MSSALSALAKQHAAERENRKVQLERKVETVLVIADDLENNCRAALGIELNSCVNNQAQLEFATKQLRQQVGNVGKKCATYNQQYNALISSVSDLGSIDTFLRNADATLEKIGENIDATTQRLQRE
jgi:hypothetical protein